MSHGLLTVVRWNLRSYSKRKKYIITCGPICCFYEPRVLLPNRLHVGSTWLSLGKKEMEFWEAGSWVDLTHTLHTRGQGNTIAPKDLVKTRVLKSLLPFFAFTFRFHPQPQGLPLSSTTSLHSPLPLTLLGWLRIWSFPTWALFHFPKRSTYPIPPLLLPATPSFCAQQLQAYKATATCLAQNYSMAHAKILTSLNKLNYDCAYLLPELRSLLVSLLLWPSQIQMFTVVLSPMGCFLIWAPHSGASFLPFKHLLPTPSWVNFLTSPWVGFQISKEGIVCITNAPSIYLPHSNHETWWPWT